MIELKIGQEIMVSRASYPYYRDLLKVNGYEWREVGETDEHIRLRITNKFSEEEQKAKIEKELAEYSAKRKAEIEKELVKYKERRKREIDEELKKIVVHHKITLSEKYGTNRPYAVESQEMLETEAIFAECEVRERYGRLANGT